MLTMPTFVRGLASVSCTAWVRVVAPTPAGRPPPTTPTSNTVTAGDGVSDIAKLQGTATPGALPVTARHGAARASPNASGALFVQLEDLTAECVAKDSDIRRLKRQSKGLEKELKEEDIQIHLDKFDVRENNIFVDDSVSKYSVRGLATI